MRRVSTLVSVHRVKFMASRNIRIHEVKHDNGFPYRLATRTSIVPTRWTSQNEGWKNRDDSIPSTTSYAGRNFVGPRPYKNLLRVFFNSSSCRSYRCM